MSAQRVLFAAWPFPGHLFPQVAVARALRRRGHDVAFYTGASGGRIVEAEGFRWFAFNHVDEEAVDELMRNRPAEPWRLSQIPRLGRLLSRWLLETVPQQAEDLDAIVRDWAPSVIATDPTLWAPMLITGERHALPVAVCSFVPAYMPAGRGVPPFGPGLPRRSGWRTGAQAMAARALVDVSGRVSLRRVNAIRQWYGLPPLSVSVTEHSGTMPLHLVPSAPEFDYDRRDVPSSVRYVGPLLWNPPGGARMDELASTRSQPCVHVTEGTVHVHRPFLLRSAIEGLADLPVSVVATTGGRPIEGLSSGALPPNVRLEPWISHESLLPHVDVVVTTGGAGSVLASLAEGVPLVIVPTEWDKPEIAQRVVEAGAGVRLAPQRCTPARLRACVEEVLRRPQYRDAARRLAGIFDRRGGAERAAELLGALEHGRADQPSRAPAAPGAVTWQEA